MLSVFVAVDITWTWQWMFVCWATTCAASHEGSWWHCPKEPITKTGGICERSSNCWAWSMGEVVVFRRSREWDEHLRRTDIQFGQYRGQRFQWFLENVVRWAVGFLKSYRREGVDNDSPLGVNKHKFNYFCGSIPEIERAVAFSSKIEAANKIVTETGDDGHRLVEFGKYNDMSWRALYESSDAEHVHFVCKYLLRKTDCRAGSKMDLSRSTMVSAAGQSEAATSASISHCCA